MDFKSLRSYQIAFELAMRIFEISKSFPEEETYSLTDQICRSSRSVCSNIAEAYRKRNYPNHFKSKLSDSDSENAETQSWLHFASECRYISKSEFENLIIKSEEVGKLLNYMINNPGKFGVKVE
ncbi:four helix bundle protein [Christiangramia sabulilitoris]|uniref:Four helix bundle protein n=1 Tax=Christiangramia sabulilitoris TaxID=2583991 RepID=A0A550I3W4_9FLAO|nr:four helix bundle protein [Christiangramia sabulilitoris]TRO65649.1 four helix bundle protein [Christiangramia sabulilitoris]